jgi:hypothetical protein
MQYTHRDRGRSPHPAGDSEKHHLRVDFDRRLKLEFNGGIREISAKIWSVQERP